ncbi:MAG: hypothetical protein PWP49_1824 [Thermococcaceae archaeon]|jgi:hypothetical protein|nr:hypothetical protein [Thermococcaceae archaeon]MDN5321404.1 hypothetical protein [Thermococcaceae archaeon]
MRSLQREYPYTVLQKFFSELLETLIHEVQKFLLTLKWVALQEDVNYPPPKFGFLYTLSVYVIFGNL